jgi:hypothetical protein
MSNALEERIRQLEITVIKITSRNAAMRDVVARLLAYLANSQDNAEELLKHFSVVGDERIDRPEMSVDQMLPFAEESRKEKDWIVSTARKLLSGEA